MPAMTQPNGDLGAQFIASTDPDTGATDALPVLGWGNAGEGWPDLTPVVATPDGPQALTFHPGRRYSYGPTAEDAAWNLQQRTN